MKYTFTPDDCMVITIPLNNIRNTADGQLMPDKFICRFKDNYKVFQRGCPKALGVAQIVTAVFILCLGGILLTHHYHHHHFPPFYLIFLLPCILYFVSGSLVIAAAHTPLMLMMKMSFILNVLGLCLGLIMTSLMCFLLTERQFHFQDHNVCLGGDVLVAVLYMFEFLLSVILIHWESKAICRAHFNSLPIITLKQDM